MGVYDKNAGISGRKPIFWVQYAITEEMRVRFGLKKRDVRERSGPVRKAADALLAQRRRQVKEGTWRPRKFGGSADSITVEDYVTKSWIPFRERSKVKSAHDEKQRLRDHVLPVIGHKFLREVTRKDMVQLVNHFMDTPSAKTQELPAPRTVHRVYEDVRTMYAHAVEVDEIVPATPCTLKVRRGELPPKEDKDPRWRASALFERIEVETLLSDEEIPFQRRMIYALMFLTGSRIGEVAGVLWRDYTPGMKPLGRILVATQYGGERTKTRAVRTVPVHPVLASMLAAWKLQGFPELFGGPPRPDDFIVPRMSSIKGVASRELHQYSSKVWEDLQRHLEKHGFRRRRTHDARRTLITLAQSDGADERWLNWITHGPSKGNMMHAYTSPPWEKLCEQISCLRIELRKPEGASVTRIGS